MIQSYKNFIPISKRRNLRKELLYQVIVEDICDIFDANEDIKKTFQNLINGMTMDKAKTSK